MGPGSGIVTAMLEFNAIVFPERSETPLTVKVVEVPVKIAVVVSATVVAPVTSADRTATPPLIS